jgi:cysteine desulfurase
MMSTFRPTPASFHGGIQDPRKPTSTTSFEKMAQDPRYQPDGNVPEHLLARDSDAIDERFSMGQAHEGRALYLDYQATTQSDPRVTDAMLPYMLQGYGNPHSNTHTYGWDTEHACEEAREKVASLIGADSREIIFTSGATESNNVAVKGIARFYGKRKKHIITTQTEHKCVLDSCRQLEQEGFEVTYLPVNQNGLIDLQQLEDSFRKDTSLVSVMGVNNEIGVVQPLKEIGEMCRSRKIFFHTDAAQMVGKLPLDVDALKIDAMSISGHKLYGPKGVGALYVRRRPRVRLEPLFNGGGQERGIRSGTLSPALAVGFGEACAIAEREMDSDHAWVDMLATRLHDGITKHIDQVLLNGDKDARYVGNLNLSFSYVEGESLLMAIKNVAVSSGSACTSASLEPSYVLRAIGVEDDLAHTSIRFGIGRFTTEEEIDFATNLIVREVTRLREMSPLWEMVQDGIDLKSIEWSQH